MNNKPPGVGITLDIRKMSKGDILSLAQEADEAGLHAIGVGDGAHDSFVMLSGYAAVTKRIRLVSSIATWTRTPVSMARACRTLDYLCPGRFSLGLGSMPPHFNEQFHGIPYKSPLKRMQEYIELVRLLWNATPSVPVDYDGEFYQVKGYRVNEPPPYENLPITVGATRSKMINLTGEIADGVILNIIHSLPWIRDVALPSLEDGAKRSGRSLEQLDKSVNFYTVVTDEPEKARTAVRRSLAFYLSMPYGQEWLISNGFAEDAEAISAARAIGDKKGVLDAISDQIVDAMAVIGTPNECRDRIVQYGTLLDWVLLAVPPALPAEEEVDALRKIIKTFGGN